MNDLEAADATIVMIVPHERCRTKWWSDKTKGEILFLADPGFLVSSMYGVAFQMRIHTDTSNTPGTFVIDKSGVLRWSHLGKGNRNWNDRPTPAQIQSKLKELQESGGADENKTSSVSRVKPGTELAESDFKPMLRRTGAGLVVVQVYAEACGPCMTEALHLVEQQEVWSKSGIAILGMGMDETPEGAKAFHRDTGERITYPLYTAPWFSEQQDVLVTPTVFVYRADGKQLFRTDAESAQQGIMVALNEKLSQLQSDGSR